MLARAVVIGILALLAVVPADAAAWRMTLPAADLRYAFTPMCPGPCVEVDARVVWVGPTPDRFTVAHEFGHIFWETVAVESDRRWFMSVLGIPADTPWREVSGLYGKSTPSELAADAFAACYLGLHPRHGYWVDGYGYLPTPRRHRRVCNGIAVVSLVRSG